MVERGETGCKPDLRQHEGGPLEGCLMFSTAPVGVDLSKLEESRIQGWIGRKMKMGSCKVAGGWWKVKIVVLADLGKGLPARLWPNL